MTVIGRLAPSPTGAQHIGNARTYLIAWLSIRSRQGKLFLRMEDIDSPRIKQGAAEQALDDLRWLGIDWDGEPVVQTSRLNKYENALAILKQHEVVYPCTCSRTDILQAASAPHHDHDGPIYPGTCSWRQSADADNLHVPYAWRMRTTVDTLSFHDGFCGPTELSLREIGGDFVVWKSAGTPAYQLAVVVDDAEYAVNEVIRGDDLIPSTPRQILLYRQLGFRPPLFVHVPLVVGPDGRRLAKRHGDTRISALREAGVESEALLGLLAWSCGWISDIRPISMKELLPIYRLECIPKKPFVVTEELLARINFRLHD